MVKGTTLIVTTQVCQQHTTNGQHKIVTVHTHAHETQKVCVVVDKRRIVIEFYSIARFRASVFLKVYFTHVLVFRELELVTFVSKSRERAKNASPAHGSH